MTTSPRVVRATVDTPLVRDGDVPRALVDLAVRGVQDESGLLIEHLRAVTAVLPVSMCLVAPDGSFVFSFGGALRRFGIEDGELVGLPISAWGEVAEEHFRAVLDGQSARFEVEGIDAEGAPWLFEVVAAPLPAHGGMVAVAVDVTERLAVERATREHDLLARQAIDAMQASEERFRRLAESAPVGIFLTELDGTLLYVNPQLEELAGRALDELRAIGWLDTVHPDDRPRLEQASADWLAGHPFLEEYRVVRPDGSVVWVRTRIALVSDDDGTPTAVVGTSADITAIVAAVDALSERDERTRAILETAAEAIITCDDRGMIVEFNAAAERTFGYDSDEVLHRLRVDELIADDERDVLVALFAGEDDPPVVGSGQVLGPLEIAARHKDGSTFPVSLAVTEVATSSGRLFTAVMHDISERRRFEQQLEHQATHDGLTGLPNRALLYAELEAALNRAARHGTGTAVLFIELDRLRVVTGSLGHRAGDQVVIEAARRIREAVGEWGSVGSFGSDQFVVVAEDLHDVAASVSLATRIDEALDQPYLIGAEEAFLTAHTGIAFTVSGASTAERLIANADVAMNRARSLGSRLEVFDAEMRAWVDRRRKVEAALRRALERGEFELHYQPMVAVATGEVRGFEALVRWNHPDLGILPPSEFVPVAEDAGLIIPLGGWVIDQACRQLAEWQERYGERGVRIAVNLSARQLAQPELPDIVAEALAAAGARSEGLDLEITESVLLDDLDSAVDTLTALKRLGLNLAMDDFGTGYSSLTYLCRLPIDTVKVDRSFVSQLGTPSRDATVVGLVVGLAQTLHLDVVAEGVETPGQLDALRSLGCSYAQGYLFAKPLPAFDAEALLANEPSR